MRLYKSEEKEPIHKNWLFLLWFSQQYPFQKYPHTSKYTCLSHEFLIKFFLKGFLKYDSLLGVIILYDYFPLLNRIILFVVLCEWACHILKKYEENRENIVLWDELSPQLLERELKGIVGFKIKVQEVQAAYKLSQNRNEENYPNIVDKLQAEKNPDSQQMAKVMKKRVKIINQYYRTLYDFLRYSYFNWMRNIKSRFPVR